MCHIEYGGLQKCILHLINFVSKSVKTNFFSVWKYELEFLIGHNRLQIACFPVKKKKNFACELRDGLFFIMFVLSDQVTFSLYFIYLLYILDCLAIITQGPALIWKKDTEMGGKSNTKVK